MCPHVIGRVFLEYLADERLGCLRTQFLDQQVDADDCQFLWAAGAVGALSLGPLGFDIGLERYGGHVGLTGLKVLGNALERGSYRAS